MEDETKTLTVTFSNGSRTFTESAFPYNKTVHDRQYESCVNSIHKQMRDAGVYESRKSYKDDYRID